MYLEEVFFDKVFSQRVSHIRKSVFGDVDRLLVFCGAPEQVVHPFRIDVPTHIGSIFSPGIDFFFIDKAPSAVSERCESNAVGMVVLDTDKVVCLIDRIKESPVADVVEYFYEEFVCEAARTGEHVHGIVRHSDDRVRVVFFYQGVGFPVCAHQIFEDAVGGKEREALLRGKRSLDIAHPDEGAGLIEWHPKSHKVAIFGHYFFGVSKKVLDGVFVFPAAFLGEPDGNSPVPERDKWFDIAFAKGEQNISIVLNFLLVKHALFGFDARPLDAETMGIVAEGCCDVEIFFVVVVMIASVSGEIVFRILRFFLDEFP